MAETATVELDADEAWLLYRLATADHAANPCTLDQPHRQHAQAAESVLRKLGTAMAALPEPQTEALTPRLAQLLAAIRAQGGDWSPARAADAYHRSGWEVTPGRGHANMKRLAALGFLVPVSPRAYTYRLAECGPVSSWWALWSTGDPARLLDLITYDTGPVTEAQAREGLGRAVVPLDGRLEAIDEARLQQLRKTTEKGN